MQANSRVPTSAQTGIHQQLPTLLERHRHAVFRKPFADYNRAAFNASMLRYQQRAAGTPLILDSCCGVGHSSIALAKAFPDHYVIGVDQSASRLARQINGTVNELPDNVDLVRADLVDYWRLLGEAGNRLARHSLLYPNPWPKIGHLSRRWHGHPVFPAMLALGGVLECRSNWPIYIDEFCFAVNCLTGKAAARQTFVADEPLTLFERKYRDSGHALYCARIEL